jgi:hypothetical protein
VARPTHGGRDTLTLASFNLDNGRRPHRVGNEVVLGQRRYEIDAMVCQEGKGYWRELKRRDLDVVLPKQRRARYRDTFLVVDKGIEAHHVAAHSMRQGWERAPGNRRFGEHPPRVLNVYGVGWLDRLAAVHMPPTPQSERHPHIARSYPKRDAAWQEYLDDLLTLCQTWNARRLTWVLAGDFNIPASASRIELFAKVVGGQIWGNGIDYFILGPGVKGHNVRKPDLGRGDHGHIALIDIALKENRHAA